MHLRCPASNRDSESSSKELQESAARQLECAAQRASITRIVSGGTGREKQVRPLCFCGNSRRATDRIFEVACNFFNRDSIIGPEPVSLRAPSMDAPLDPISLDFLPLVAAALALLVRGVVLGGETALAAVGLERAEELAETKSAGKRLVKLKSNPDQLAGSVRSLMTLALTVAAASLGAFALSVSGQWAPGLSPWIGVVLSSLVAWLLAVLVDVLLRSLASAWPETWALRTGGLLLGVRRVLSPFGVAVEWVLQVLFNSTGVKVRYAPPPLPLEEIERLLVGTREEGAPEPELVKSLFEFGDRKVKEIMVPRTDIFAIPHDAGAETIVRLFVEEGHTRVPVYQDTLDRVVGIVHVKDVMPLVANPELIILQDLMRPPMFVPWNRPISKVMRELQRAGQHLSVVVDEYGGISGIVTLEDIVEQIVGDIRDEFDDEEQDVRQLVDGTSMVQADMRLEDFNDEFDADLPEEEGYETLGGFLISLAGAIPAQGDLFYQGVFEFLVTRREPHRVIEVKVTRTRAPEPAVESRT